jgi:hypothetical protein
MFQNPCRECLQLHHLLLVLVKVSAFNSWWWGLVQALLQRTSSKQSLWSDPTRNRQLHNFEGTVRVQSSQLQEIVFFFSQLLRSWKFGFCFGFKGELASASSCCFSVDQRDRKLKLSGYSKGLIKRGFWRWFFLSFLLPSFLSCRYLRDNFFTGNIPEELGNLTQLTRLWVAKPPGLVMIFFCTRSWLLQLLQQSGHSFFRFTISSDFFFPIFWQLSNQFSEEFLGCGLFTSWVCMYLCAEISPAMGWQAAFLNPLAPSSS